MDIWDSEVDLFSRHARRCAWVLWVMILGAVLGLLVQASTMLRRADTRFDGIATTVQASVQGVANAVQGQVAEVGERLNGRPCDSIAPEVTRCTPGLLPTLTQTAADASDLLTSVQHGPVAGLNATLANVNRLCPGADDPHPKTCGTLADLNRTLATGRKTMGEIEKAAIHENRNLGKLDGQEDELFSDVHNTLNAFNVDVTAGHDTIAQANIWLRDPRIGALLGNAVGISGTFDHMLGTFDQVETKATYNYLNPARNPFKRTWQVASPFLLPGAQVAGAVASSIR